MTTVYSAVRAPLLLLTLAVVAMLTAVGCGNEGTSSAPAAADQQQVKKFPEGTTMRRIQDAGVIRIGVKYDAPPFGFQDPRSREVKGFDVDLGRAIAARLGVEPKFVETISDNRIPFLRNGTVDLVIATMTITGERAREVDFSEPYYVAEGRLLVPKGSDVRSLEDLDGRSVCVTVGSTFESLVRRLNPEAQIRGVDGYSECLELLQTNAVDAVASEDVSLIGLTIQDPDLKIVGRPYSKEAFGIAVKKNQEEFVEFINDCISDYKKSGQWEESYDRWVGRYTDQEKQPPTLSLRKAIELRPEG